MKELGITKGDIVLNASLYHATNTASWISADIGEQTVAEFKGQHYGIPHNEVPHNANLFLDAHNTAQKCGLLPSELLRQRDELRMALINLLQACDDEGWNNDGEDWEEQEQARAAIKNTDG